MNCSDYQNELYELFGQGDLPKHLRDHVKDCDECRAIHAELSSASAHLGENDLFFMDHSGADEFLADLNHRLDTLEQPRRSTLSVFLERLVPIAAAAVIMLAIAIPSHYWQQSDMTDGFDSLSVMDQIVSLSGYDNSYQALDDQTVSTLLEDYSSRPGEETSPSLIDDLTDEEWNYLNQNFDIGEIL